jgi:dTDP-4-dehydrorhamnose reductase
LNQYGKTKSAAEDLVLACNKNSLILRTNFFGWSSNLKRNYLELSINKLEQGKKINAFEDYFFTPIYIGNLLKKIRFYDKKKCSRYINLVGDERVSKYQFFLKISKIFNFNLSLIIPTLLSKKKNLVKRHNDISLSNLKIKKNFKIKLENLDDQIKKFYEERNLIYKFKNFFIMENII